MIHSQPGRVLRRYDGNSENVPLCEGYNCDCENLAVVTIQGETDSFGFETLDFCESCYNKMLADCEKHEQELREENNEIAPEGYRWIFTATRQDDTDWYCKVSKNKADCAVAQERAELNAAYRGGLYNEQIRLVTEAEALSVLHEFAHRHEQPEDEDEE